MTVAANGIRIHVKEQDKGDLPLVFLHSAFASLNNW